MTTDLTSVHSPWHLPWCHPRCAAAASGIHASRPVVVGRPGDDHVIRARIWAHSHLPEPRPAVEIVIDGGDHNVRVDLDLAAARQLVVDLGELLASVPTRYREPQPHRMTP